jgi:hypothetical protein
MADMEERTDVNSSMTFVPSNQVVKNKLTSKLSQQEALKNQDKANSKELKAVRKKQRRFIEQNKQAMEAFSFNMQSLASQSEELSMFTAKLAELKAREEASNHDVICKQLDDTLRNNQKALKLLETA